MFKKLILILYLLTLTSSISTIYLIYTAPIEANMGIVQKIFYLHMPSAVYAMILFLGGAFFSALFLWKKKIILNSLALSFSEVGVLLSTFVIISGPLWAKKSWGVYWNWDPRLTFTLLIWMVFLSYTIIQHSDNSLKTKKVASVMAIIGSINVPIIHFSVKYWSENSTHPIVIQDKGIKKGLADGMVLTLYSSLIFILLLSIILVIIKFRLENLKERALKLERNL